MKIMPKKKFILTNDFDGNDQFEVERENLLDACLEALEQLGWGISED